MMKERIKVLDDFPNIAELFPNGMPSHHPLYLILLNGLSISAQQLYLWHIDRLILNVRNVEPEFPVKLREGLQNGKQFHSSLAELETFYTLTLNERSPRFVCKCEEDEDTRKPKDEENENRLPDIAANSHLPLSVEVTNVNPDDQYLRRWKLSDQLRVLIQSRLPDGYSVEVDSRNVNDSDVRGFAKRIEKFIPNRECTIAVNRDVRLKELHADDLIDFVGNPEDICVVRVTTDIALSPLHTEGVMGTSLGNRLHKKIARRQILPDTKWVIVVDVTTARGQLSGEGFEPAINLAGKFKAKSSAISGIVLRCTFQPPGKVVRKSTVAFAKPCVKKLITEAFSEEENLPIVRYDRGMR